MLNPAVMRKVLGEFLLRRGDDALFGVKRQAAGAGGALIDGEDDGVVGHAGGRRGWTGRIILSKPGIIRSPESVSPNQVSAGK